MKKAHRLAGTLLVFAAASLLQGCRTYPICGFAGSYACAQTWSINASEASLAQLIKELKTENPQLQPPADTSLLGVRHSYWLFFNFYYPDTKETVQVWLRPAYGSPNTETTIALTGFFSADNPKEYREINRDFRWKENAGQIRKFERLILKPLQQKASKQRLK